MQRVSLLTIFMVFLKVGAFTIGGGYAMLPVIQREVVHRHKWLDQSVLIPSLSPEHTRAAGVKQCHHHRAAPAGFGGGLIAALGVITAPILVILAVVSYFYLISAIIPTCKPSSTGCARRWWP